MTSENINLKVEKIVDPRGNINITHINLAKRLTFDEFKNGRILFYDNTKLSFCNYSEIYASIKKNFYKIGVSNFIDYRETVRGKMTSDIKELALKISKEKIDAAIVGLADMGTTPMTTVLAIEFEKANIPTVLISAPPGYDLAKQVAYYRAGNLCICNLDIYQASTKEEIENEVEKQMSYIIKSFTISDDQLIVHSKINSSMDGDLNNSNSFHNLSNIFSQYSNKHITLGSLLEETLNTFDELFIGDGLPIIPPTEERIMNMMKFSAFDIEEVLIPRAGPSGRDIQVKDVIINAVIAGCKPEYLPILITVFRALANPKYNFQQSVTTSYNGGNLVLVSGPIANELGIHSGQGCLGPGFRANATIGRAVNLTILNVCRAIPGKADLGCLGSPAEYSYCFAEDLSNSPWPGINAEYFNDETTTVYVLKAEPPTDIVDFLSQRADDLLETIIDSASHLGRMNAYIPGKILIVLTPDHSKILQKSGWDKNQLRQYLFEKIQNPKNKVAGRGLVPVRPNDFNELDNIPATRSCEDIDLVVAGGRGGHSAVIASWGLYSEAVIEPLQLHNGKIALNISDYL